MSTIDELSQQYIKEKAHVLDENKIQLEIMDVRIYPSTIKPTLQLDCGFPFEDYFIRLELDSFTEPGYDKILDLYPNPFDSLDYLKNKTVKIRLKEYDMNTIYNVNPANEDVYEVHPEDRELEIPIEYNGFDAHLCKLPRYYEHSIECSKDMSKLKSKCEKSINCYSIIEKSIDKKEDLKVQNISVIEGKKRTFVLKIGPNKEYTLPIKLTLPSISDIQNHPTSEFINNFASGDISKLENEYVYIGYKDNKNCIGTDIRFGKYGIHKSYPSKNSSLFTKINPF